MSAVRCGFIMEQTLGHITHDRNLRNAIGGSADIDAEWLPVEYDVCDRWQRMPGIRGNWTLKASLRARDQLKSLLKRRSLDSLFFHTQTTALWSGIYMKRIPAVVSMDATPKGMDSLGHAYDHAPSRYRLVEILKHNLTTNVFRRASHLVTWSEWAKNSLRNDYNIPADIVHVIPPGVDIDRWATTRDVVTNGRVRILFVGGDFKRKGGETLLEAYRMGLSETAELDIVTKDHVCANEFGNVRIHNDLNSNAPELIELFRLADIFVLPTLGDALGIAFMEAMAAGLPVIATNVGAVNEVVDDGVTGILVPPGDTEVLMHSLQRLVRDRDLRVEMGREGVERAKERFNATVNYAALVDVCRLCAGEQTRSGRG